MSITVSKDKCSILQFSNVPRIREDDNSITFEVPLDYTATFLKLIGMDSKGNTIKED